MKITLRAARINAGLDQTTVAKELGVNVATISRWENGKSQPTIDQFRKMCAMYGWPEADIILDDSRRKS